MSAHLWHEELLAYGEGILRDPLQNRDAAFTPAERKQLGIEGLLPPGVLSITQQVQMELEHIFSKNDPLEQYIGLIALLDRNETLFYRVLIESIERLAPIIYTPTVGLACERYSHIFRRPRGLFLCPADRGHITERLRNLRASDIRLIVVTDNERILGLGDQGTGGMAIPIGKLALYTAGAGIRPTLCLPVSLDVGTDNPALLNDPFYLGYRSPRLRGPAYDEFIEEFVQSVKLIFPRALLQWEDFKKCNAFRLLERYACRLPSFNDDIQGTSAVTLAGIFTGLRLIRQNLRDQRFLFVGAGAAGVGIGRLVRTAMVAQGLKPDEVRLRQMFVDSVGIVQKGQPGQDAHKQEVAWTKEELAAAGLGSAMSKNLEQIIRAVRPTVLIGTSGQPGDFTPAAIQAMAEYCERPLIFPLSNPTAKAECTPAQALQHSEGRALVATGSPFDPVVFNGHRHIVGQCNNVFIFPGVGVGALVSGSSRVTDSMFLAAANALAKFTAELPANDGSLYPPLCELRRVSRLIAFEVARTARDEGFCRSMNDQQLKAALADFDWYPDYTDRMALSSQVPALPTPIAASLVTVKPEAR